MNTKDNIEYLRWLFKRVQEGKMCPVCFNWNHACTCSRKAEYNGKYGYEEKPPLGWGQ